MEITLVSYFSPACPTMRGSTPLDVAASSVMDNNSLALALEEPDLEKVTGYYNISPVHVILLNKMYKNDLQ